MTKARQHRLKEARQWFENQNFTEDSHIVKAYRKRFNVDNTCAKRELCMLGVLSPHKQAAYEEQLKAKDVKKKRKREAKKENSSSESFRDEWFYYIAEEEGLIEDNFMTSRDMKCPKIGKPVKKVSALSPEDQKKLVDKMTSKTHPLRQERLQAAAFYRALQRNADRRDKCASS